MNRLCFLVTTFLLCQCGGSRTNNDENDQTKSLRSGMRLSGIGESGISGRYNDWTINILDSDSIEMLCSLKEDSFDTRSMNRQYFGHITSSDNHNYKIVIDRALYVDDCNEPDYSYLKTDTIPFYFNKGMFKRIKYWDFKITNKADIVVRITETSLLKNSLNFRAVLVNYFYPFVFKEDSELRMTLHPDEKSGYYPITIRTGKKCQVEIANFLPEMDYYLDKVDDNFKLITDITRYSGMQNKKCDYCIKEMKLKTIRE